MHKHIQKYIACFLLLTLLCSSTPLHAEESLFSPLKNASVSLKEISDTPFPTNTVVYSLPSSSMNLYPDSSVFHFDLVDAESNTPVDLSGKYAVDASFSKENTGLRIEKKESSWPTEIRIFQLEKRTKEKQKKYKARLSIGSTMIESTPVFFDTIAPEIKPTYTFPGQQVEVENTTPHIYFTTKDIRFSFGVSDSTNGLTASSYPLKLQIFPEKEEHKAIFSKVITTSGEYNEGFSLPDNFSGLLNFALSDKGGNTSLWKGQFNFDTQSPVSLGNNPVEVEQSSTEEITLHIGVTDNSAVASAMELSWDGTSTRRYDLPESLFSNSHKNLSGVYTIPFSLLPNFPEGKSSALQVRFFDKAGNSMLVKNISTTIDHSSPQISNVNYSFNADKSLITASFDVTDSSPLTVSMNGKEVQREQSAVSTSRRFVLSNLDLKGFTFPLIFSVKDQKNSPSTFSIDDRYSLIKGKLTTDYKIPLTYMLPSSFSNAQVQMTISGTGGKQVREQFTGATGTLYLSNTSKGTYTVQSIVSTGETNPLVYNSTIDVEDTFAPPTLSELAIKPQNPTTKIFIRPEDHVYVTGGDDFDIQFQVTGSNYSLPIDIKLNGKTVKTISERTADSISVPLHLERGNEKLPLTLSLVDRAKHATSSSFTIFKDSTPPSDIKITPMETTTDTQGTSPMKKSKNDQVYITKSATGTIEITTKDEGGKAPTVSIKRNTTPLFLDQPMTESSIPHQYTFTVPNVSFDADDNTTLGIEIQDELRNKISKSITISRSTSGPKVLEFSMNSGIQMASDLYIPVRIKAAGTGVLSYELTRDTLLVDKGEINSNEAQQRTIALPELGNNTFILTLKDELGTSVSSTPVSVTLDYKNPLFTTYSIPWTEQVAPNIKVTLENAEKSYSSILANKHLFTLADLTSQLSSDKVKKIPVGEYSLRVEGIGANSSTPLTPMELAVDITPYYFDADGDLNGDGFAAGLTDAKLFYEAKKRENMYSLTHFRSSTLAEQHLEVTFKKKCMSLHDLFTTNNQIAPEDFYAH